MSNIMIIYPKPNECKNPRFGFSYDMLIIATVLDKEGNNVYLKDFSCEAYNLDSFCAEIIDKKISFVLIEFDSFALKRSENYIHGLELIHVIKKANEQVTVIAYGHYCYILKKDICGADITIKENSFNIIFDAINNTDKIVNKIPLVSDFDSLPKVNRALLKQIDYYEQNSKSTLVQTAVGCENSCIFCQRKGWQERFQTHSDQYVLDEFKLLQEHGFINIWITDENFTFNLSRAKRILQLLINNKVTDGMKISISSWSNIDIEFLNLAKQSNIKTISLGIESGNQDILNYYRKNIDLKKTKSVVRYANEIGIFTIGNFIIGAPLESYDTINDTFKFIRECEFDQVNIKTLDYMMGSELYTSVKDKAQGRTHLFACSENGTSIFSLKEISGIKNRFLKEYNVENKERMELKIMRSGTPYDP